MLFCCPISPSPIQAYSLPPFRTNSLSPSIRGSGAQSFPAKNRSLRVRNHPAGGYGSLEQQECGHSSGSAAPSLLDAEALASWLRNCSSTDGVRQVHAVAVRSLDILGTFVANNLISAYARFDEVLDARKVFDEMPERSVVSWTAMMNGYLKLGHYGEVVRLFFDMVGSGLEGNSLTFVCLLRSCGERGDVKLGQQIHCCIVKGGWSNVIVDSAVAHFYAQCGDVASASAIFDKMASRDVIYGQQ